MKTCLVLEGGAFRALYTAGVLDKFLEENINIDTIISVSASSVIGINYFSKQKARIKKVIEICSKSRKYISMPSLIFTGNLINKKNFYYKLNTKTLPIDNEEFKKDNKTFVTVLTNVLTGKSEYYKVEDPIKDMELIRASSSLPKVSRMVKINNNLYLDGAITDSIPIEKALEKKYDKIVCILTRPKNYTKKELLDKEIKQIEKKYKKYPNFINAMINRSHMYNEELKLIDKLEKEKKIFVIRPKYDLNINILEKDVKELESIYDTGYKEANKRIEELKNFLK